MDESTFETFEEELGKPLQEVPPQKPLRQPQRPEMHAQRRVREEPQIVQQKALPHEAPVSRVVLRKALSIENVAHIEVPWEGVTLNRCLLIAITILILTSSCQRLHEFVRGHKDRGDVETLGNALNMRYTAIRKGRLAPPQPEPSMWDSFFGWVMDDDDEIRCISKKVTRERASRSIRHKAFPDRKLLKRREESFKARREKVKRDNVESQERMKAQTKREKKRKQKKLEEEEQKEEKILKRKEEGKKKAKKVM